ncbi:hypothetical protein [Herbaspirillum sp. VT-16-41]|uniref:hypothetical protein n=1 Tax=Herbaspirillum sp. VT-16-41 TaxID=1953765 RepID=UPI000980DCBC|nr:hypothetical protein [Herbaspirillum sp. VT-16-41]ONN64305.1 hypothetical protein BTM36_22745 [Herbaspirillum sp. VT-16-41]
MEKSLLDFFRTIVDVAHSAVARSSQWPRRHRRPNDAGHFFVKPLMYFITGSLAAGLTLLLTDQLFFSPRRFVTIIFYLAPFAVACLVQEIAHYRMKTDSSACPRTYLSQSLWYSSGFASIKFFYFSAL